MRTGDTGESEKRKSTFKQNRRENSPWFGLMTCHLLACTACQEDLRFLLHGVSSRGLTIPSLQLAAGMAATASLFGLIFQKKNRVGEETNK